MVRNKKGFTLIELLIVVVIIGILAAIAIPKFTNTKAKAYVSAMKADLRNLATAQEQFAADNAGDYKSFTAAATTTPTPVAGFLFTQSPNVAITATASNAPVAPAPKSWTATATHTGAPNVTCTMTADGVITGC